VLSVALPAFAKAYRSAGPLIATLQGVGGCFLQERDRWILWAPVLLGIGVGIYFGFPVEPARWVGIVVIAVPSLVTAITLLLPLKDRSGALILGLAVVLVALGFSVSQFRTHMVGGQTLSQRIGPVLISGRVLKVESFGNGLRVTLDNLHVPGLAKQKTPDRVRVRLRGTQPSFEPGSWLSARAVLVPPPEPSAPGAFDFQRYAYYLSLGGVGYALGQADVNENAPGPQVIQQPLNIAVQSLRHSVAATVRDYAPDKAGAIMVALLTGERTQINEGVMQSIRDSGLAHLLAISGLHIGLVAAFVFSVIRAGFALVPAIALRYPIKKWAAVASLTVAGGYTLLAGATVPSQRAFFMLSLVLFAVLVDRRGISMRLVAWAAFLILLFRPELLLSASFQLSFAAVVGLIAAYEELQKTEFMRGEDWIIWRRVGVYLAGIALSTIIATLATTPYAAYHFNRLPSYGLVANMLAVPITALWIMPWGVLALAVMPLGLQALALEPMSWGVNAVISIAETVSHWPAAVAAVAQISTSDLILFSVGALWLCLWHGRWRWFGMGVMAVGLAGMLVTVPPDLLVDNSGRLFAVRSADGDLMFSSKRRGRFTREAWLRRSGRFSSAENWPARGSSQDDRLACDDLGCIYHSKGHTVALAQSHAALAEDCRHADVIVSTVPLRIHCPSARRIIDRFDLWRNGAHAIWLEYGRIRIESVNAQRGYRPWVTRRERQ